jgi:hypothetical protein
MSETQADSLEKVLVAKSGIDDKTDNAASTTAVNPSKTPLKSALDNDSGDGFFIVDKPSKKDGNTPS